MNLKAGLQMQQFMAHKIEVQTNAQFAYAPEELEALLRRSGFSSIKVQTETYDAVYESVEDWWQFLLTLAPRATS